MKRFCVIFCLLLGSRLLAAEVIPPAPTAYFNDYAQVVSTTTAAQLNHTLADFERQTSEQIVVAVFPKLLSDSSVEDYAVRVFRAWGVGQKDKNNGAVLFVFVADHKMFLQTGYGLEGVLPDALCKRIIDEQITPRFKAGDFTGGLTVGVQSILAATKGEYKGNGQTVAEQSGNGLGRSPFSGVLPFVVPLFIVLIFVLPAIFGNRRSVTYGNRGRRYDRNDGFTSGLVGGLIGGFLSGGGSNGGSSGGGGGFSGGGGGDSFSGGGGSSGGGGAGGSW